MVEPLRLPLFPLRMVLFPGGFIPIHVFEERYLTMIGHCLEGGHPFGVVLIRVGREVGGRPSLTVWGPPLASVASSVWRTGV
jgi:Lon protease-like protein